jgi:hypothetical protein
MHDDNKKRSEGPEEDRREAVEAADDTGMVRQHELLTEMELEEARAEESENGR